MFKTKKAKIALFSGIAVAAIGVVAAAIFLTNPNGADTAENTEEQLAYTVAKEGSIASSKLLSGTVGAAEEQYVYYDASKGDIAEIKVKQGDQVTAGQALVQYNTTELQANYDTAVRARDKIGRQIYDLKTNGQTVNLTGDSSTDDSTVASTQRSVDLQLQDLNDQYADAQVNIDKAQAALDEATINSTVSGTVVEVNSSVSKSNTSTNQTVVHVVNQGSLQVVGNLSEYDLANIAVDQAVKITSKVYPDQVWNGKITYISNYPENNGTAGTSGDAASASNAKYLFKVAITDDAGPLKQGFSVNIEVVNQKQAILVPVTAVVTEGDKQYVWTIVDGKAHRVEVTLGSADASNQEISSGLTAGDHVISNPNDSLQEGKEVNAYEENTDQTN